MTVARGLAVVGFVVATSAACGTSDSDSTVASVPGGSLGGLAGGGATQGGGISGGAGSSPGTSSTPGAVSAGAGNGNVCQTQVIDAYGAVPDMLIVLDRSLSMQINMRWGPSTQAVQTITSEFEGLVSFGLEVFPDDASGNVRGPGGPMCGTGQLSVDLALNNAGPIAQAMSGIMPAGMTPTGAALDLASMVLGDRTPQVDATTKPGYVLLVTDGDPSCNPAAGVTSLIGDIASGILGTPPPDAGMPAAGGGDVDQQNAARQAIMKLKATNIPTYVIGYQIDPAFQPLMNELAQLGGTMAYHPAESGDQIIAAFREITKNVVSCTFDLASAPGDPKFVRVEIDKVSIPLNSPDGWVINGKTITLQGAACATLKDGKGHLLNAQVECTEVVLN